MDELLTQFLIESRELVDQAVDDLLALEKAPSDRKRFDDAFRAFHTLKGGAGIVEFAAMQTALHCAESALAAARIEARPVSAPDIGNCLRCLDQVAEWLDMVESAGAIPADADAAEIVALFARDAPPLPGAATRAGDDEWVATLVSSNAGVASRARTALRYVPASDCFFRGEDPLGRIAALPGLLAVDLAPRTSWPTLDELDPFSCNLTIRALLAASPAEVGAVLGGESRYCEVKALSGGPHERDDESLARKADELLEAQLRLLESATDAHQHGRIASAGLVAANVLRHRGRSSEADAVATAAAVAIAESRLEPLIEAIRTAARGAPPTGATEGETSAARPHDARQTIRVSAERVDALVRLTGELIVSNNAIGHAVKLAEHVASPLAVTLKNQHAVLNRLVAELQRAVVGMRVLPLSVAFRRFPRLVREISAELKKPATLVLDGADTEADKAIVETLVEPLVHLLRNALDHGVEDAAVRAAAGKPAVATIDLRAFREGEHVIVEVADDGAGIDVEKIKQVAEDRNLAAADDLAVMSDEQALELVFLPGFSTAQAVTELSGRGVGMDAVRTAVGRLGGQVDLRSAMGKGTTVRVTLPFSVLVTQVMTVEAGGQLFGIPLDAIVETLRVEKDRIFPVGAAHAIVLRDRTIPLVRLADVLTRGGKSDDSGPIVIAQLDGGLGAVQVDRIGERMDVILKPLDGLLSGVPGLAGSTLLGDGSVLLVLDLGELVR